MVRWTEITPDFEKLENEKLKRINQEVSTGRSHRLHRIVKSIVVPGLSGIILLITGSMGANWGYSRVHGTLQAKKAEKLKEQEQQEKLQMLRKKISKTDNSAKELLYDAYYKEQEKEREEEAKLEAIRHPQQPEVASNSELQKISKELLLAIQQKEFADHKVLLSAQTLENATSDLREVENKRILLERKLKTKFLDQDHQKRELQRLRQESKKANVVIDNILKEKEGLEKESLTLTKNQTGMNKDALLGAIKKIEDVDRKLQEAVQKFEILSKKIEGFREEERLNEQLEKEMSQTLAALNETLLNVKREKEIAEREFTISSNTKRSIESAITSKMQFRDSLELKTVNELKKTGKKEFLQQVSRESAQFFSDLYSTLKKLEYEEGLEWLDRAKFYLSQNETFLGKLILARIQGFIGHGIAGNEKTAKYRKEYPPLFSLKDNNLKEARKLFNKNPSIYPLWQTPIEQEEDVLISISFSPDGRVFASTEKDQITLWNLGDEVLVPVSLDHVKVEKLAFSPDCKTLASASGDHSVRIWNYKTHELIWSITGHREAITALCFNADGTKFATASKDHTIKIWDTAQEKREPFILICDNFTPHAIKFSDDGNHLFSNGKGATMILWDYVTGTVEKSFTGHQEIVTSLDINSETGTLLSTSLDSSLRVWDIYSGNNVAVLQDDGNTIEHARISPNGKWIAAVHGHEAKIWDANSKIILGTLSGYSSPIKSISFSPDSSVLATATSESIKFWSIPGRNGSSQVDENSDPNKTASTKKILQGHSKPVITLCFSNDSKFLASAGRDKTIKIWEMSSGWDTLSLTGHEGTILDLEFSNDDSRLISASTDSKIKVWNSETGQEISTINLHSGPVYSLSCSPDGKTAASAGEDAIIKLWNIESGKENLKLVGHRDTVIRVCFNPDGKMLASSSKDGEIKLWNARTGLEISTLKGHLGAVFDVRFSTDGFFLISGGKDKTIKLWNLPQGKEIRTLNGHSGIVYSIGIHPNGRTIASASKDGTVKIWDLITGVEESTMEENNSSVLNVTYSKDGAYLALGNANHTISLMETNHPESFDYMSYLSWMKIENFRCNWLPISAASSFLNIPKNSFLTILRSGLSEEKVIHKLFWYYSNSGDWNGAMSLFDQLPNSAKGEAENVITEKLKWKTHSAIDRGYFGLANRRMEQLSKVTKSETKNHELSYLEVRNKYLGISLEARGKGIHKSAHHEYSTCMMNLNHLLTSGTKKTALQLANDFGLDIFESLPSKQMELEEIPASHWIENAQIHQKTDSSKAVEFCLRALQKDETFVETYAAPENNPQIEYILACAYAYRAGENPTKGQRNKDNSRRQENILKAIERLRLANEKGWEDWEEIESESYFDGIRSDPVYKEYTAKQ